MSKNKWQGTPVYFSPSRHPDGWTNVFHRDKPGVLVARFYGESHFEDAKEFCRLHGERDPARCQPHPADASE